MERQLTDHEAQFLRLLIASEERKLTQELQNGVEVIRAKVILQRLEVIESIKRKLNGDR